MAENEAVKQKAFTLEEILFDQPYRFDFFQAVRLLERIYADRRPIGDTNEPDSEIVRLRSHISLNFPPSQITTLTRETNEDEKSAPAQMTVAFMGLTGPVGVLPHAYTELLMERMRAKDFSMVDFFDVFNHRVISMFYRAWEKYRFPVSYERTWARSAGKDREANQEEWKDRFTESLFDLAGLGTRGLRKRFTFQDEGLLSYGGLIANKPHSASAMCGILGDYFAVPATIEQFKGQWLKLEPESYSTLGTGNCQLGLNTVSGIRVWDSQSKFRVIFGPLTFTRFIAFLPVGSAHQSVIELIRFLAGQEYDFDLQLKLKKAEVPGCKLTTKASTKPMLGWTTWLKTKNFIDDDGQVILAAPSLN